MVAKKHAFDKDPETGHMTEVRYFGEINPVGEKKEAAEKLLDDLQERYKFRDGIPGFEPSMDFVKKFQPKETWTEGNSNRPQIKLAGDLYDAICRWLAVKPDDPENGLRFYTAVGSPLDYIHGVDAFFQFGETRVLIDVTKNVKNKQRADSEHDTIIMEPLSEHPTQYKKDIQSYAEQISGILMNEFERIAENEEREKNRHLKRGKDDYFEYDVPEMPMR